MSEKTFSMEDLKKRIQDQTVVSMGMMMPDEHLKQLVDEAIEKFFKPTDKLNIVNNESSWNPGPKNTVSFEASPFEVMVWYKVKGIIDKHLNEYFQTEMNEIEASVKTSVIDDRIKEMTQKGVMETAPYIGEVMSKRAMSQTLEILKNDIRSTLYQNGMHNISF